MDILEGPYAFQGVGSLQPELRRSSEMKREFGTDHLRVLWIVELFLGISNIC